jgi:tetratricopeptide (TPR) repeat protein
MKTLLQLIVLSVAVALAPLAAADAFDDELLVLQENWAQVQYQAPDKEKADAFERLHEQAVAMAKRYPQRAEPLVWDGIILSTWAGAKGGLGALSLVKQARAALESSLAIDDMALQGSAYTSLGSLYYQVPGWPIAFGDDDKAEKLLKKALAINPDGIDPNFFYADFLKEQGRDEQALQYFRHADAAPPRPDRPIADQGRHQDIRRKLEELNG